MSMYYKRGEFQKRWTVFFCSGLVAGAFGGVRCLLQSAWLLLWMVPLIEVQLLAFALAHMDGLGGYSGWRWYVAFLRRI